MKKEQCVTFGKRLSELRTDKGLTQIQLAETTKIQRVTIAKYERGERAPSIDNLLSFVDYFGVSSDYLLGLSNIKSNNPDISSVCAYTGLSEEAVLSLHKNLKNYELVASMFLSNKNFYEICHNLQCIQNRTTIALLKFPIHMTQDKIEKICNRINVSEKYLKKFIEQQVCDKLSALCQNDDMSSVESCENLFKTGLSPDFNELTNTYRYNVYRMADKICDLFDLNSVDICFNQYNKEEILQRMADYVNISVDELLNLDNKEAPDNGKHNPTKE